MYIFTNNFLKTKDLINIPVDTFAYSSLVLLQTTHTYVCSVLNKYTGILNGYISIKRPLFWALLWIVSVCFFFYILKNLNEVLFIYNPEGLYVGCTINFLMTKTNKHSSWHFRLFLVCFVFNTHTGPNINIFNFGMCNLYVFIEIPLLQTWQWTYSVIFCSYVFNFFLNLY